MQVLCGKNRPLRVVLVRDGPAEISEQTIAQGLSDEAVEALNLVSRDPMKSRDQVTERFGVGRSREGGRVNHINKQYG